MGPFITQTAEDDLSDIRAASPELYGDILRDITDLIYRVHDKKEIKGSTPESWTVEISHGFVVAFSYSYEEATAGIWVQLVARKSELDEKLRAFAIRTEDEG